MSELKLANEFCSSLHSKYMKAMGFRKKGRIFSRECNGYSEGFSIQGSTWNSGKEPWHFYINIFVTLHDIPLSGQLKFHADGRLGRVVPSAPSAFDLTALNFEPLITEVAKYITESSQQIPGLLANVRLRAISGLYSPLPVPSSWLNEKIT